MHASVTLAGLLAALGGASAQIWIPSQNTTYMQ